MTSRAPAVLFVVVAAVLVALPVLGFDPREFARRHGGTLRLSIATGNTGGVYYPYGGGIARIISQSLPNVDATAEVTSASVDNLKLIQQGKADIAFTFGDTLDDAVRGRAAFTKSPVRARTLAVLYPSYTQIATLEGNNINRLTDLRGRVVSTGSPGSGTEVVALRLLKAAGLDADRDLRRQGLSVNASVDALKDGKIDAFFWTGGIPTASLLDLTSTIGIRPKLLANDDLLPALQAVYGPSLYYRLVVPGGTYPGLTSDVGVVAVANVLVVNERMSDDLAYDLTKVLFDKQRDLAAIHPEGARLTLETAIDGSPAPYHPGAIRYYRERAVWKR
jgi:TRAP transporter TAXI family solute receptor